MALVFDTADGPVEVDGVVVQAVVRYAEFQAEVVAACLKAMGHGPKQGRSFGFPAGYLLELGAILQLRLWETAGLREFLDADLPTSDQASADLYARAVKNPTTFDSVANLALGHRVVAIWLERFVWDAPDLMQADVLIGRIDDDALVDAVAKLLWSSRNMAVDHTHSCQPEEVR